MLSETAFAPFFQFLYQKLSAPDSLPDPHLISQAKKYVEDSVIVSDRFLSKCLYKDSEEILLDAIKIQQKLFLQIASKDRLFTLFFKIAILYKMSKNPEKGYKILTELLAPFENAGVKQKNEFSLYGIEKIYIVLSEFCLDLGKFDEARKNAEKALDFLGVLMNTPTLLQEFKHLINNNEKFEEKIRKKNLELAHARAILSKGYRKEGDYEKAYEHLEKSTKELIETMGETNDLVQKFQRKLAELGKKRDFFLHLKNFEEDSSSKFEENINFQVENVNLSNLKRKTVVARRNSLLLQKKNGNKQLNLARKTFDVLTMKNSIPMKKFISPPDLPKLSNRKLTIPDINILTSQGDPRQPSPSEPAPKDPLLPRSQDNPYFLSKGFTKPFQVSNFNSKSKLTTSVSRVKPPSLYPSSYRNPLSKSTAYVSNNFLSPSGFISSQRSHNNDSFSKNPQKAEFRSKLTEIFTGKKPPKTFKKETSIENYANPFLTDRAKVNKMKKNYLLITRPQPHPTPRRKESSEKPSFLSGEIPERQAISIEKQPSKLTVVERISHKNIANNENNAMGLTVIQLSNASKVSDNQARSPLLTPTHRMAVSPLDSFSKKINPRRSDVGFSFRKNLESKKSFSYRTNKRSGPGTFFESQKRRQTMAFSRNSLKSPLIKSPSLESLSKIPEFKRKSSGGTNSKLNLKIKSESCFSENSPFLPIDRPEKRKKTWEYKDFGSFSVLSRNRNLDSQEAIEVNPPPVSRQKSNKNNLTSPKKPHVLIILRRRLAANKIFKALRKWFNYRKFNVIFNKNIPMGDLIETDIFGQEKPLIEKLSNKFQKDVDLNDFPKTPKHVFERNKEFFKEFRETPKAFYALTAEIRKSFPSKGFNVRFFHQGQEVILKEWKVEQERKNSEETVIRIRLGLESGNGRFLFEKNVSTLLIKDEFFYYRYVWPLMDEILKLHLKEKGIILKPREILENKDFKYKEKNEKMEMVEILALRSLIEIFKFLLDRHLIKFKKTMGTILSLYPNPDFSIRLENLLDFLKKRREIIRKSVCHFEVISPFLLNYLGFEKKLGLQNISPSKNPKVKKAWSLDDFTYAHVVTSFLGKKSFADIWNNQGLSSVSSNISPKSIMRNTNKDFEISMRRCEFDKSPYSNKKLTGTPLSKKRKSILDEKIPPLDTKNSFENNNNLTSEAIFLDDKKSSPFSRKEIEEEIVENELSLLSKLKTNEKKENETEKIMEREAFDRKKKLPCLTSKSPPKFPPKNLQFSFEKRCSDPNIPPTKEILMKLTKNSTSGNLNFLKSKKRIPMSNPMTPISNPINSKSPVNNVKTPMSNPKTPVANKNYIFNVKKINEIQANTPNRQNSIKVSNENSFKTSENQSKPLKFESKLEFSSQESLPQHISQQFFEAIINKEANFPSYLFNERPIMPIKKLIVEGNFFPFFREQLLYTQVLRRNGLFFLQTIRVNFQNEMAENLIFDVEFFMIKNWEKGYVGEKLIFPLERFTEFFFPRKNSFPLLRFIYRRSFSKTQKLEIHQISKKSFSFENATFVLKEATTPNFYESPSNDKKLIFSFTQSSESPVIFSDNWLANNNNECRIMNSHHDTLFLRNRTYYLRFSKVYYYRFEFSEDFLKLRLSSYNPFIKQSHYCVITSQSFIEKVIIILQQQSEKLRILLMKNLLTFQKTLVGRKLIVNPENRRKKQLIFLMSRISEEKGFFYVRISIFFEKKNLFMVAIELKPANSKTKNTRIELKPKDLKVFFDFDPDQGIEQNYLKDQILNKIKLKRGLLYKTPVIFQGRGGFLEFKPPKKNDKPHMMKRSISTSSVFFQKTKKFCGTFAVLTVIKQEKLDFWNLIVDFPIFSRRYITNFFKSDILKLREECLEGLFAEDMEELRARCGFLFKQNSKKCYFHHFHEIFSEKQIKDIFRPRKSIEKIRKESGFISMRNLKESHKQGNRKMSFIQQKTKSLNEIREPEKFGGDGQKEFLTFCEIEFWDQLMEKMELIVNQQGKFILKIDTYHGVLREIISIGTINYGKPENSQYFECFLERGQGILGNVKNDLREILKMGIWEPRQSRVYLRITDLERRDCKNFKFPLDFLGKLFLEEKYKANDLKKIGKMLKKYIKSKIPEESMTKISQSLQVSANFYKINGDFHDYRLNFLKNPEIILLFRGVFSLRPRKILAIFLNKKKRRVLFFLFDNLEAKELINVVKIRDLGKAFPFVEEMMRREEFTQELGERIFKFFKNQLFFHNLCFKAVKNLKKEKV